MHLNPLIESMVQLLKKETSDVDNPLMYLGSATSRDGLTRPMGMSTEKEPPVKPLLVLGACTNLSEFFKKPQVIYQQRHCFTGMPQRVFVHPP